MPYNAPFIAKGGGMNRYVLTFSDQAINVAYALVDELRDDIKRGRFPLVEKNAEVVHDKVADDVHVRFSSDLTIEQLTQELTAVFNGWQEPPSDWSVAICS